MVDPVDSAVNVAALDRIDVVRPASFHVHQMKQPGTIRVLIEHPHGQQVLSVAIPRTMTIRLLNHVPALHKGTMDFSKIYQKNKRL